MASSKPPIAVCVTLISANNDELLGHDAFQNIVHPETGEIIVSRAKPSLPNT
jgi:hypothetical protein